MDKKRMPPFTWSVDFDETLFFDSYLSADVDGRMMPNTPLIEFLKYRRGNMLDAVILVTMREGNALKRAIEACKWHGLEFDAVNDNLPEWSTLYGNNPRKIFANVNIDDRNVHMSQLPDLYKRKNEKIIFV